MWHKFSLLHLDTCCVMPRDYQFKCHHLVLAFNFNVLWRKSAWIFPLCETVTLPQTHARIMSKAVPLKARTLRSFNTNRPLPVPTDSVHEWLESPLACGWNPHELSPPCLSPSPSQGKPANVKSASLISYKAEPLWQPGQRWPRLTSRGKNVRSLTFHWPITFACSLLSLPVFYSWSPVLHEKLTASRQGFTFFFVYNT